MIEELKNLSIENQLMLVFSATVSISTIIYVFLTAKLAKQTRLSREFFLESHIIAYITNSGLFTL